jgi:hypothetical protein
MVLPNITAGDCGGDDPGAAEHDYIFAAKCHSPEEAAATECPWVLRSKIRRAERRRGKKFSTFLLGP